MKKTVLRYNILLFAVCPLALVCALTAVSSFATRSYEYLPASLEFMSVLFYDLATFFHEISVFFAVGAFAYAIGEKKTAPAVTLAITAVLLAGLLPMIEFLVRMIFLSSGTDTLIMAEYWTEDAIVASKCVTEGVFGMLVCAAVTLFFSRKKIANVFEKPYLLPNNITAVSALIIAALLIIPACILFAVGREYSWGNVAYLFRQLFCYIVAYFAVIFGSCAEKRTIANKRC